MKNNLRTLEWTDSLIEVLTSPRSLAVRFAGSEKHLYGITFLIPMISTILMLISISLLSPQTGYFYFKITYGWIFLVICSFVNIFLSSAVIDLVFQFKGKRGSVRRVINIINISYFPKILMLPLILFFSVIDFAPPFFFLLLLILLSVWSLYVISRGLSEIYSVDLPNAFLIYAVPYAAVIAVSVLLLFLLAFLGYGFAVNF
ncbi:MAG: YIP1 family protein [Spirochaetes bacterium]|nr:YIP1 family protein [Spirochaetota bacterium]